MKLAMMFFVGMALRGATSSSFFVETSSLLSWGEQDTLPTTPTYQEKADAEAKEIAAWMPASKRRRRVEIESEHRHIRGHQAAVWSPGQPEQFTDDAAPVVEWIRESPPPTRPSATQPKPKIIAGTRPETAPSHPEPAAVAAPKPKAVAPVVPPAEVSDEARRYFDFLRQRQLVRGNASGPAAHNFSAKTASEAARRLSAGASANAAKEAPPFSPPAGLTHFGAAETGSHLPLGATSGTAKARRPSVANTSLAASRAPTSRSLTPQTGGSGGARADEASSHLSTTQPNVTSNQLTHQEKNATPTLMTAHAKGLQCVCGGAFREGDRVKYTGHSYPPGRTFGTILGGTVNGFLNVEWDHWSTGHNGNCKLTVCGSCAASAVKSRWFTSCDQLAMEATESMEPKVVPAAAAAAP